MNKIHKILVAYFLLFATYATAEIGIVLKTGTMGHGLDVATNIAKNINVRGGISTFSFLKKIDLNGNPADLNLDFSSQNIMIDYHVFGGSFRLSSGLYLNDNELNVDTSISQLGTTLKPNISLSFDKVSPYVGFGWGDSLSSTFGFHFEVGALLPAKLSAKVTVDCDGDFCSSAPAKKIIDELKAQESTINDEVSKLPEVYPLLTFGITYKF